MVFIVDKCEERKKHTFQQYFACHINIYIKQKLLLNEITNFIIILYSMSISSDCDDKSGREETVLIFGGSGLVGRAIEDELVIMDKSENIKRTTFLSRCKFTFLSSNDADLTNFDETKRIFELHKPDYVINLAAKVGGLYANIKDNETFYEINYKINENVLKLSHKFKIKKCFSCLSTCIFPDKIEQYPLNETMVSRLLYIMSQQR